MRIALFSEVFLPKIDGVVTRLVPSCSSGCRDRGWGANSICSNPMWCTW
jgi:hypothetical protein